MPDELLKGLRVKLQTARSVLQETILVFQNTKDSLAAPNLRNMRLPISGNMAVASTSIDHAPESSLPALTDNSSNLDADAEMREGDGITGAVTALVTSSTVESSGWRFFTR